MNEVVHKPKWNRSLGLFYMIRWWLLCVTFNSNLVPLIDCLCTSNSWEFEDLLISGTYFKVSWYQKFVALSVCCPDTSKCVLNWVGDSRWVFEKNNYFEINRALSAWKITSPFVTLNSKLWNLSRPETREAQFGCTERKRRELSHEWIWGTDAKPQNVAKAFLRSWTIK